MDFLFAMSVFSSAADISREKGKAQEWLGAWVVARDRGKVPSAAGMEEPAPQRQNGQRARQVRGPREGKLREGGRPSLAPEFDGINCFETIVLH